MWVKRYNGSAANGVHRAFASGICPISNGSQPRFCEKAKAIPFRLPEPLPVVFPLNMELPPVKALSNGIFPVRN
jgi:hypothetical protein